MKKQTFSRSMACGFLVIAFFLLPINRVYASTTPTYNDNTYWSWWYVEQSTGVSADDIQNTDAGIPTGEYIANNGGGTRQNAYDWIKDKYDNATEATANSINYYYNAVDNIYDRSVDYAEKGFYQAENAVRKTVDKAGKVIYDVSGSDYWNSFYNQMYNGGGGKDIYVPSDNESYTGDVNGHTFKINWFGVCGVPADATIQNPATDVINVQSDCRFANNLISYDDSNFWGNTVGLSFSLDGNQYYIYRATSFQGWFGGYDGLSINGNTYSFLFHWIGRSGTSYSDGITVYFTNTVNNAGTENDPILQPSQMGFIIDPLTGDRIPVYTDPSKNPFTINPNGTVTMDGNDYPIYVDPDDISDDGWLWILRYLQNQDQTDPTQNPWGQPWNTQPDGTSQGGLFSNLVKDISSMFGGIADKLGKLFQGLLDGILKALKGLFDIDFSQLNSVEFDVDFNIIENVINKLLEMLGVTSCFQI